MMMMHRGDNGMRYGKITSFTSFQGATTAMMVGRNNYNITFQHILQTVFQQPRIMAPPLLELSRRMQCHISTTPEQQKVQQHKKVIPWDPSSIRNNKGLSSTNSFSLFFFLLPFQLGFLDILCYKYNAGHLSLVMMNMDPLLMMDRCIIITVTDLMRIPALHIDERLIFNPSGYLSWMDQDTTHYPSSFLPFQWPHFEEEQDDDSSISSSSSLPSPPLTPSLRNTTNDDDDSIDSIDTNHAPLLALIQETLNYIHSFPSDHPYSTELKSLVPKMDERLNQSIIYD
ncbi:uncharacterized protein BX664DRAFT_315934 [Halteromyces radiatus]|uniref:uncharacterized protein n=1 Tax=Halteromyces radiatus TaxID=101107 RepID=UPI00221F5E49|nr:uncharacterized protein BX664DRAFT_315934 [Halteromyces radiatus]KAI8086769.1 hypothetical protein BX664DRAFT_315934 [Halteromyces radiatus]